METVGFIGLGQMGAPMARRLAGSVGRLVVFDSRREALAPLAEAGAHPAESPLAVAASTDMISIMVRDDEQVRAVLAGDDGVLVGARPGTVVAIHSTIRADTAEALAKLAAPHGVEVVDAPVSGGFIGARDGRLAAMVGGSDEAFARCRETFGAWADLILHMGPVGAGTRAKLARNLLHFVSFGAAGEAQRLAEAAGLDLRKLAKLVRHSDAVTGGPGAIMLRERTTVLPQDDPWHNVMANVCALGEKDLSLALELGGELGLDLPLAALARDRLATELGVPHADTPAEFVSAPAADPSPAADSAHTADTAPPAPNAAPDGGRPLQEDRRQRGLDMMNRVYGFTMKDRPGDFFGVTVDHLFAEIWTRPGLRLRDRRLLLLGMLAAQGGLEDIAEIQVRAALGNAELTPDELREIVVFLTHYVGWPLGSRLNMLVEKLVAERSAAEQAANRKT